MDPWSELWPSLGDNTNNTHFNQSLDVISQGCFVHYNVYACVRNGLLSFVALVTLLLCGVRLIKLYLYHLSHFYHYCVFLVAAAECLTLFVKYTYEQQGAIFDFLACYLKLVQFMAVCHYHWILASRIMRKETMVSWISIPLLCLTILYFSFVAGLGMLTSRSSPWNECFLPHWLLLSAPEFLVVQLLLVPACLINRKINSVTSLDSFKREQKLTLWGVVLMYELSATVCLAQELVLITLGDKQAGCSSIYGYQQRIYSPTYFFLTLVKFFLPIWVLWWFMVPVRRLSAQEQERLLGSSSPSTLSTTSSRTLYRPLFSSSGDSCPARPSSSSPVWCRHLHSSCSLTPVCSPSSLAPISEEEDPPRHTRSYGSINCPATTAAYFNNTLSA